MMSNVLRLYSLKIIPYNILPDISKIVFVSFLLVDAITDQIH